MRGQLALHARLGARPSPPPSVVACVAALAARARSHLDVGYTNTIASTLNDYFHIYFPRAIATAAAVNAPGQPPLFRYTSHAFLLDVFFDCPRRLGQNCSGAGAAVARS